MRRRLKENAQAIRVREAVRSEFTRFVWVARTWALQVGELTGLGEGVFFLTYEELLDLLVGKEAEQTATIRHGVRALSALYQTNIPWCSVIIRTAFGVAGGAQIRHNGYRYRYAWPSGDWGSLPVEGGIEAAYKSEIAAAADPDAHRIAIEERLNRLRSPFRTAEAFAVEDIIDPRETRAKLCGFANNTAHLRRTGPSHFWMRP